ncbi:hypothetical protein BU16DRAFT_431086, partial [Lophium mytilinum]
MTPNLYLATQTLFSPHKWFVRRQSEKPRRQTEHWEHPISGTYEYIPGRGWYLVATDYPDERLAQPIHVKYSKVLKRYMLQPDYDTRKRHANIKDDKGKTKNVCFFRLDDGVAWVHCWDNEGHFIPGPYKMWCVDKETNQFRHMLKGDDPYYTSRSNSRADDQPPTSRRSQESRSTQYRGEGSNSRTPNTSQPSTRSNSVRGLSAPPTRPGSPRGS